MPPIGLVTPIWREQSTATESAFLRITDAANRDLSRTFLAPVGLDTSHYARAFPEWGIRTFPAAHFASTRDYSRWLTDPAFYRAFDTLEFLVICQLDAVLRRPITDVLPTMASHDLLGARWLPPLKVLTWGRRVSVASDHERREGPLVTRLLGRRLHVGNGGLTVRRTEALIRHAEFLVARFPVQVREHIQEDVLLCATASRTGLRIVPPAVASTLVQETEVAGQRALPDVIGFHGLERWNPELAAQLIADRSAAGAP